MKNLKSLHKSLLAILPAVLWIMGILLPILICNFLLDKLQENEKNISKALNLKHLIAISKRFSSELNPSVFLTKQSGLKKIMAFKPSLSNENKPLLEGYNKLHLIENSPKYNSFNQLSFNKWNSFLKDTFGNSIAFSFTASPIRKENFFYSTPIFSPALPRDVLQTEQLKLHNQLANKFKSEAIMPRAEQLKGEGEFFQNTWQTIGPICNSYLNFQFRFSNKTKNTLACLTYPILEYKKTPKFLVFVVNYKLLSPRKIFSTVKNQLEKKGEINFELGKSNLTNFPHIYEKKDRICGVFKLPLDFEQLVPTTKNTNETKVFQVSIMKKANKSHFAKSISIAKIFYLLIIIFSLSLITKNYLENGTILSNSISQTIVNAILFLTVIPGVFLFSISFFYIHGKKHNMHRLLQTNLEVNIGDIEERFILEETKLELFTNLLVNAIEKIPYTDINQIFNFFNSQEKGKKIHGIYTIIQGIASDLSSGNYLSKKTKQSYLKYSKAFNSAVNEILRDSGFYKNLTKAQSKEIRLHAELSKEIISQFLDKDAVSKSMLGHGHLHSSPLASKKAQSINHILYPQSPNSPRIFMTFICENYPIFRKCAENIPHNFIQSDFKDFQINYYVFQLSRSNSRKIVNDTNGVLGETTKKSSKYFSLASALIALGDKSTHNSLNSLTNTFAVGKISPGKNIYILAVAKPQKAFKLENLAYLISMLFMLGIFAFIALGISWYILLPLPPILKSFTEMKQGNFFWKIKLNSRDEFYKLGNSLNNFSIKLLERKRMANLVSEDVMEVVAKAPDNELKTGGKLVYATVLFSDIRSFTTITEQHSAEEIVEMLNDYFTIMLEIIKKNGGRIDKLIGDAIQAVFYDSESVKSANLAIKASIQMMQALEELNKNRQKQGKIVLRNGIGISSGRIISGLVGSQEGKLASTIFGKKVNDAETLEALSKQGKFTHIFVDEKTKKAATPYFKMVNSGIELRENEKIFEIIANKD